MKLLPTLTILGASIFGLANAATLCGKCAFDGKYCDVGGAYRLCYGQMGCGGSTICSSGCHWNPDNPDYNGLAQC
ncbi:hypothetical protein PSPO01_01355 [Paraphaeosphaeria sporulosa]